MSGKRCIRTGALERKMRRTVAGLVVDGSAETRIATRLDLELLGCEVVAEAANGLQGLALVCALRPGLVVFGAEMCEVGGIGALEFLRLLRANAPWAAAVALSARMVAESREEFVREGIAEYLRKPLDREGFARMRLQLDRIGTAAPLRSLPSTRMD
jgi:CheY-like chemotaxis protein